MAVDRAVRLFPTKQEELSLRRIIDVLSFGISFVPPMSSTAAAVVSS